MSEKVNDFPRRMSPPDRICRLCMGRSNLIHTVFEDNLLQKVAICVSLLINTEDKNLSLEICALCALKVKDFYEFRQNCLKVQQLLEQNKSATEEQSTTEITPPAAPMVKPEKREVVSLPTQESLKITKLEVVVEEDDDEEESENDDQMEDLVDEIVSGPDSEHLIERLDDTPEEDGESLLEAMEHRDDIIMDFENTDDSDYEAHDGNSTECSKNSVYELEMVELISFNEPVAPDAAGSEDTTYEMQTVDSVSVEVLQNAPSSEPEITSIQVRARKTKDLLKSKQQRDEKEIYRSLLLSCEVCGKSVERNRMEGHRNRHKDIRPYVCSADGCNAAFHCKIALRLHTRGRHGTQQLPCDKCQKVYSSKKGLYHHMKEVHGEKRCGCEQCGLVFISQARLNRHMLTHSEQRDFKCPHCPKEFYRSNNLKVHMRSHTKEKPFACTVCDKAFGYQRLLREHVAKKHTNIMQTILVNKDNKRSCV